MKKEKLITAQSSSFIRQGVQHMVHAKKVYDKNIVRQPIAELENFNASEAIVDFLIFLESHFNRIGYFKRKSAKTFQYDGVNDSLETKIARILPRCPRSLIEALEELKQTRHAIIHAHLWTEERTYDKDYELIQIIFRQSAIIPRFRTRFKHLVDFSTFRTKKCYFNIIPTMVNFIDALKTLLLTEKIVNTLQEKYGRLNVMTYLGPLHLFDESSRKYLDSLSFKVRYGTLEEWIRVFSIKIHKVDNRGLGDFTKFITQGSY